MDHPFATATAGTTDEPDQAVYIRDWSASIELPGTDAFIMVHAGTREQAESLRDDLLGAMRLAHPTAPTGATV